MRFTGLVLGIALVLHAAAAFAQSSLLGVQSSAPQGSGTGDGRVWTYVYGYYADGQPIVNAYRRTHGIEVALMKEVSPGIGWRRMHTILKGRPQDLDKLMDELRSRKLLIREERPAVLSLELEYWYTPRGSLFNDRKFYTWDPTHNSHRHPADALASLENDRGRFLRTLTPPGGTPDRAIWKLKLMHETQPLHEGYWLAGAPYR